MDQVSYLQKFSSPRCRNLSSVDPSARGEDGTVVVIVELVLEVVVSSRQNGN
jgi:hypothetical protein